MSQISGAFTVELQLDHLADAIADRVIARLHQAAAEAVVDEPGGGPLGHRHQSGATGAAGDWEGTR